MILLLQLKSTQQCKKLMSCLLCRYVKAADKEIIAAIKAMGRLVDNQTFTHSYPFCWRSETPLIYRVSPHAVGSSVLPVSKLEHDNCAVCRYDSVKSTEVNGCKCAKVHLVKQRAGTAMHLSAARGNIPLCNPTSQQQSLYCLKRK